MYHLTPQKEHGYFTFFVDQKNLLFFTSNPGPLKLVDLLFVLLDFWKENGQQEVNLIWDLSISKYSWLV